MANESSCFVGESISAQDFFEVLLPQVAVEMHRAKLAKRKQAQERRDAELAKEQDHVG